MRVITQVALVSLFALTACGPKKQAKQPDDDIEKDTVETPQEVPWPTAQRACGDTGNWCGPLPQVQAVSHEGDNEDMAGDDEEGAEEDVASACPEAFMREPYNYTLDVEQTTSSMAGNCCYDYVDDHCKQP